MPSRSFSYIQLAALCVCSLFAGMSHAPAAPDNVGKEQVTVEEEIKTGSGKNVNWAAVESIGTISAVRQGAMEKTAWKDQKRSVITKSIEKAPNRIELRSLFNLQRRLLLSQTNAGLVDNDVPASSDHDLLIVRMKKLMAMGLYDDAWALYTQKADQPYDESFARQGMILLILRGDMATACLEEKVFSSSYPESVFFKDLDTACQETLGVNAKPQFPKNKVLQSIYNDPSYKLPANAFGRLHKLGDLERAILFAQGRVDYTGVSAEILRKTPSSLLSLYLMDKTLPETGRAMVTSELNDRGLAWHTESIARTDDYKRAKTLSKDPEDQWTVIDSAIKGIRNPADLIPYVDMLEGLTPENLSTEQVKKILGGFLANQTPLSDFWVKQAQSRIAEKPMFAIYLMAFKATTNPGIELPSDDILIKAFQGLKGEQAAKILGILQTLDDATPLPDILKPIYDKNSVLTENNNYVMPTDELTKLLDSALEKKQIGITVLATSNSLATNSDLMYIGTISKGLKSMMDIGLYEDSKLMGSEIIANILNKY